MPGLDLVPVSLPHRVWLLDRLMPSLERAFQLPVRVRTAWFDLERCYDSSRGQYRSTAILERLLAEPTPPGSRILAVTGVDLFIPILTFVFGEAQVNGRAAVVSTHRLENEAYGLPRDDELLAGRLEKEAVHELGHTYGLLHCTEASCVMHSSTYVEEIDLKEREFCEVCLRQVRGG
jgi:archaemetzincin